jgi:galactokinase
MNEKGFFSYVAGTCAEVICTFAKQGKQLTHGIEIDNYLTTLPMGKGMSSSAAVCVLVAKCFDTILNLNWSISEIMEVAFRGEMRTPSRCGRMDQCVAMGPSRIATMEFDRDDCQLRVLNCEKSLHFVVADLNRGKNTVDILRSLSSCFPFPTTESSVSFEDASSSV